MAYESKLLVVFKSDTKSWEATMSDFYICEEIATFKLCQVDSDVREKFLSYPNTDCCIWVNDEPTHTDCYGQEIKEIPIKDAIKILNYASSAHDYRRYEPCASLLRGFNTSEWDDKLVVLHYGY